MPHIKSAKKRLRQNAKLRAHNRTVKKAIKLQVRAVTQAPKDITADKLKEEFRKAAKQLDKAAARHIIHRNLAARKKSQLARLLNAKSAPAPAPTA